MASNSAISLFLIFFFIIQCLSVLNAAQDFDFFYFVQQVHIQFVQLINFFFFTSRVQGGQNIRRLYFYLCWARRLFQIQFFLSYSRVKFREIKMYADRTSTFVGVGKLFRIEFLIFFLFRVEFREVRIYVDCISIFVGQGDCLQNFFIFSFSRLEFREIRMQADCTSTFAG